MRRNRLKDIFGRGDAVLNGWLHIPSSVSAEVMAHAGFDSLTVDLQHGLSHFESAVPMFQAISTTDTVPLARVPWNEPGIMMKLLDAGGYGVICPMINSAEEASAFVGACRYPPHGYRSYGPTRASLYAGTDYAAHANDEILTFAMIETAAGLENLTEIVQTPGLDAVYVGPADLSQSLGGQPGADFETGPVVEALAHIAEVARAHGVVAGLHSNSPEYAKKMIRSGYRFVTVETDLRLLSGAAKAVTQAVKGGEPDVTAPYSRGGQ